MPRALAEATGALVEGTLEASSSLSSRKDFALMNDQTSAPPPILSGDPTRELEQKVRRDPANQDAKVDLGSDESMDASDPPSASQPGCADEPVPSSGFPQSE